MAWRVIGNRQNFKFCFPACEEKKGFVFICRLAKSGKKVFLCSLCCSLISADNGDPVARSKEPFLCSFFDIEISKFRKDLLLFFLIISWIWFLGKIRLWRKCWVYKTTSSLQLNCNCQHSIERKIPLSKVDRKTLFWMIWSLFLPSKIWTLGCCVRHLLTQQVFSILVSTHGFRCRLLNVVFSFFLYRKHSKVLKIKTTAISSSCV